MAGFDNDVVYGTNVNFSTSGALGGNASIVADGQMLIGTTAPNAGGTTINVGTITSPLGTISVGYSSPNITLDVTGGANPIEKINVQTGTSPIVPSSGSITFNGAVVAAGTNPVRSDGTGANTMALEVQISQAIAATDVTKIGLSNFNSAQFTVDANGFVSTTGSAAFPWTDTSGTVTAVSFNGYFITAACTSTLPASPSQGDTISYAVDTASALVITAAGTQRVRLGSILSTAGGTCTSTSIGDSITLVYRVADTTWFSVPGSQGTWTIST